MKKPLILVTNDDSIYAKGILALVEAMKEIGEVVVVAPSLPQSGMGHAVTLKNPITIEERNIFGPDVKAYTCSGTPVDSVKIARDVVLHRKPDICVSGINHGSNSSVNILYSGTMSAAVEAAIEDIPSIGFSLDDQHRDADFTLSKIVAKKIVTQMLAHPMPKNNLLNVNIPKCSEAECRGYRMVRQAHAKWTEEFEERVSPRGQQYFWMTGKFVNLDAGNDTDEVALSENYVSIVPIEFDLTHYENLKFIQEKWEL
jgi:5'-nucleotidase